MMQTPRFPADRPLEGRFDQNGNVRTAPPWCIYPCQLCEIHIRALRGLPGGLYIKVEGRLRFRSMG